MVRTDSVSNSCARRTPPLHQPEGQLVKCLTSSIKRFKTMLLLEHHLGGLHQLRLAPPPEGIALGHTRESRPGSQCGCGNGAKRKGAEHSFKTAPSSLSTAPCGGKYCSISKVENGVTCELGQLLRGLNNNELTKNFFAYRNVLGIPVSEVGAN